MPVTTGRISLDTHGNDEIQDITGALQRLLSESRLASGILTVFCPSSTSGLTTVEFEPGAVADLKRMFTELVPSTRDYAHNATWDDGNGHSHMPRCAARAFIDYPVRETNPHPGYLAAGCLH